MFDYTEGGEVTNLAKTSNEQTSLTITWQCSVDGVSFDVGVSLLGEIEKVYTTAAKSMGIIELKPDTEYTVRVYTKKTVGGVMETIGIAEEKFSTGK